MKKIILSFYFLGILLTSSYSQVTVQLISTDPYYFHAKDVMKILILSQLNSTENVKLKATISYFDAPVVILNSKPFNLTPGSGLFDLSNELHSISWVNNSFREADENTNGMLPGNYKVCYEVLGSNPDIPRIFLDGKDCETFRIEFPTPLLLAYPFDKSEIEDTNPQFTWIAPLPAGLEKNINYKMSLYENKDNKAGSAILTKRPIAVVETPMTTTNLPSTVNELEPGISYLWKVDAYLGKNFLVTSDVWEFKIKLPKKVLVPEVYVKLNDVKEDIHVASQFLRIIYTSDKIPGKMNYKISNPVDGRLLREGILNYVLGENLWEIPINGLNLENENFLLAEFSTTGNSFKMKFLPLD
jgi:hypothetical protein